MNQSIKKRLLITSGNGPVECRMAVAQTLRQMEKSARDFEIEAKPTLPEKVDRFGPGSVILALRGEQVDAFVREWTGTVQWVFKSPVRRQHKRQNWFVGVFELDETDLTVPVVEDRDLRYESFRAGGPGGQHQNTTDSAIRITHLPTGETAISRDERSQHRNKAVARERLMEKFLINSIAKSRRQDSRNNQLHKELERGNPVKIFRQKP